MNNRRLQEYCVENGIEQVSSGRYRHDQNGVSEKGIDIIGVSARTMMVLGCAPAGDAEDALAHAMVIKNNSPTVANKGWTPLEKEAGKKLPINQRLLRGPLFCLVMVHLYPHEQTLVKRAEPGVYLGYDPSSNTYRVKVWETGRRFWATDVEFFPDRFPYRADPTRFQLWLHNLDGHGPAERGTTRSSRTEADRYSALPAPIPDVPTTTPLVQQGGEEEKGREENNSTRKSTRIKNYQEI